MSSTTNSHITLKDGRRLGYAEYGDLGGQPVLHFHGTPSSRFEGSNPDLIAILQRLGVRFIVVERPGYGRSDFQPKRTFLDWADDVAAFASALHIDRFSVTGLSGGGPYVSACAYKIPHRLHRAGIISGIGPLDAPGATDGMGKSDLQLYDVARKMPWLLRPVFWYMAGQMRSKPEKTFEEFIAEVPPADKIAIHQPNVKKAFMQMVDGAFEQGGRGTAWEYILFVRPWGFPLEKISHPVYLWHGEADNMCPVGMGRHVAQAIPNCQATFIPGEGHISLVTSHFEEIIRTVTA